jgi:hypothetical protein
MEPRESPSTDPGTKPSLTANNSSIDDIANNNLPITISFTPNDEEDTTQPHAELSTDEQELMHWHLRLSHLPFTRLLSMARLGLLPKRLLQVQQPFCSGCAFGRMTRRPWRTKAPYNKTPKQVTQPGQCVSVDQLDSTTPGFIG